MPIHFLNKSVNFVELCALYAVADMCLVTSTRDGMNLVSYEYVACQQENHGVLVLSEFAGAAQSLYGTAGGPTGARARWRGRPLTRRRPSVPLWRCGPAQVPRS